MKSKFSPIACAVAFALYFGACKKNTDSSVPNPQTNSKPVLVTLQPAGEFSFNQVELPEGKAAPGSMVAKTRADSTLYMVELYNGANTVAFGIFDRIDSVHFIADPATNYTVRLTVIQRGTGDGLANQYLNNTGVFYYDPLNDYVTNQMDYTATFSKGLKLNYQRGSMRFTEFPLPGPGGTANSNFFGEVLAYTGTATVYNVSTQNPTVSIPLKRLAFGLKYTCPELTQGKLIITNPIGTAISQKVIYPSSIDTTRIYSCLDFILADTLASNSFIGLNGGFLLQIVWELPDGRKYYLGKDSSYNFNTQLPDPRRNRVLNVKITLPNLDSGLTNGNRSLGIKIDETPLTVNTPIRF